LAGAGGRRERGKEKKKIYFIDILEPPTLFPSLRTKPHCDYSLEVALFPTSVASPHQL